MIKISLYLDDKLVKSKQFDNLSEDNYIKVIDKMVRRYDGYPFAEIKNTSHELDKLVYDLSTFNHQTSRLEVDFKDLAQA